MCKPSKPDAPEVPEPKIMRNPFLDAGRSSASVVEAARTGRSSLRIPLDNGLGIGFGGQNSTSAGSATLGARGNFKRAPSGPSSTPGTGSRGRIPVAGRIAIRGPQL